MASFFCWSFHLIGSVKSVWDLNEHPKGSLFDEVFICKLLMVFFSLHWYMNNDTMNQKEEERTKKKKKKKKKERGYLWKY